MTAINALVPAGSNALTLGFSGSLGNLDAYISAVNRLPMLTQEEEVALGKSLKERNDIKAAETLVTSTCAWWCRSHAATWVTACRTAT